MQHNYEKRIVLYLDILGFKNHVDDALVNNEKFKSIYSALLHIYNNKDRNYKGPLAGVKVGTHISSFSDNMIISSKIDEEGAFFFFLNSAYFLINEIIWDGFLVRGAITIGDLYHDEKMVFGPALNKAYELENSSAIYPRVIIEEETFNYGMRINPLHGDFDEEVKYCSELAIKDEDGFRYIDFMSKKHQYDDEETYINLLIKIKNLIENGIKASSDPKIKAKYLWLKTKYNDLYNNDMNILAPGKIYLN